MFVVCRDGHLLFYWGAETRIFLEKESCVIPSRRDCLNYLIEKGHSKDRAVEMIKCAQKEAGSWFSI